MVTTGRPGKRSAYTGPTERVVVDEVSSGRGLVRVDDVAQLGSRAPHPDTYGPRQH